MALYVYGIMRAGDAPRAVSAVRGGDVPEADAIGHGQVSALVSRLPDTELRMRREGILAHANVLQSAFECGPVLPLRLGTVVADADTVTRELIAPRAQALAARLDALDGKVEMQVKAIYAEAPLLRSILARDAGLRSAIERNRTLPEAATHFERMRIGEAIAAAVQARQSADGDALLGALQPRAIAVSLSPPHHERAVLNAAFLVDADQVSEFDGAVEQLSEDHSAEIAFKLIGPMPPYSFAEGEWNAVDAQARRAGWA
jgi:hypothetical protein